MPLLIDGLVYIEQAMRVLKYKYKGIHWEMHKELSLHWLHLQMELADLFIKYHVIQSCH